MVRRAGSETLGEGVYEQLRASILSGRFDPASPLRPLDLAGQYSVGAGVIREALTRLAQQGLVVNEPNRGFRVMSIDAEQVADLVELRSVAEGAALRLSVERGDFEWDAHVLAAHHQLVSAAREGDLEGLSRAHEGFHHALVLGCGNDRLVSLCVELFAESELYRRWANRVMASERPAGVSRADEHLALRDAALTRNADELVRLHDAHLHRTAELALRFANGQLSIP